MKLPDVFKPLTSFLSTRAFFQRPVPELPTHMSGGVVGLELASSGGSVGVTPRSVLDGGVGGLRGDGPGGRLQPQPHVLLHQRRVRRHRQRRRRRVWNDSEDLKTLRVDEDQTGDDPKPKLLQVQETKDEPREP